MKCRECEDMMPFFIKREVDEDDLEPFLKHIHSCKSCYEDLEILYMVDMGVRSLEDDSKMEYNLQKHMDKEFGFVEKQLQRITISKIIRYVIMTISFWMLLYILIVQVIDWL